MNKNKINAEQKKAIIKIFNAKIEEKIAVIPVPSKEKYEKLFSESKEGKEYLKEYEEAYKKIEKIEEEVGKNGFYISARSYNSKNFYFSMNSSEVKGKYGKEYDNEYKARGKKIKTLRDFKESFVLELYDNELEAKELMNDLMNKLEKLAS